MAKRPLDEVEEFV